MKVFISWSGGLSHKVALLLKDWLRDVIQSIDPFVSSEDIVKGARWFADISGRLEATDFGIICLTRENLNAPWVLFEAGALSKSVDRSKVCPVLVDLSPADVVGPLAQFQTCTTKKDDIFGLLRSLNQASGALALEDSKLQKAFERCWPEFEDSLKKTKTTVTIPERIVRPAEDIQDEILRLCRSISQAVQSSSGQDDLKEKVARLTLEELLSRCKEQDVNVLGGSSSRSIIKLMVLAGSITDSTKRALKEFAAERGFDLRLREQELGKSLERMNDE